MLRRSQAGRLKSRGKAAGALRVRRSGKAETLGVYMPVGVKGSCCANGEASAGVFADPGSVYGLVRQELRGLKA